MNRSGGSAKSVGMLTDETGILDSTLILPGG